MDIIFVSGEKCEIEDLKSFDNLFESFPDQQSIRLDGLKQLDYLLQTLGFVEYETEPIESDVITLKIDLSHYKFLSLMRILTINY